MTGKFHEENQSFWRALPTKTVFAVLDEPEEAASAIMRLERAGVESDRVRLWRGERDAEAIEPDGQGGLWSMLANLLQQTGDTYSFRERLAKELRGGRTAVAVNFEDSHERAFADRVFRRRGGRPLAYTDNWTLRVLH